MSSIYAFSVNSNKLGMESSALNKNQTTFGKVWSLTTIEGGIGIALTIIGALAVTGVIPGGAAVSYTLLGAGGALVLDSVTAHAIHSTKMRLGELEEARKTQSEHYRASSFDADFASWVSKFSNKEVDELKKRASQEDF